MLHLFWPVLFLVAEAATSPVADTLYVPSLAVAPVLDGHGDDREYGPPAVRLVTAAGEVHVWVGRSGDFVYLAAMLPDSTFYWGDDFVLSLDPDGSGGATPGDGDRQWYMRRDLDSTVVATATNGRWQEPGSELPRLRSTRHHTDWDIASTSSAAGWSIELRIRQVALQPTAAIPRLALRTYNDRPSGWWSWPPPPTGTPAQRVERSPEMWIPLRVR